MTPATSPDLVTQLTAWVILLLIFLLGLAVVVNIYTGKIDLSQLISEPSGDASMSRFQFLIFTFVIAASLFLIVLYNRSFPATIPQGVLVLLGISSSSYLVSKGIQFSSADGITGGARAVVIAPQKLVTKAGGPTQQFQISDSVGVSSSVTWSLDPDEGYGEIDRKTGLYSPPPAPGEGQDPVKGCVEVKAVSTDDVSVYDVAIVRLG